MNLWFWPVKSLLTEAHRQWCGSKCLATGSTETKMFIIINKGCVIWFTNKDETIFLFGQINFHRMFWVFLDSSIYSQPMIATDKTSLVLTWMSVDISLTLTSWMKVKQWAQILEFRFFVNDVSTFFAETDNNIFFLILEENFPPIFVCVILMQQLKTDNFDVQFALMFSSSHS